jgi:hypothetical protein
VFRAVTIPSKGAVTFLNASRASNRFTIAWSAIAGLVSIGLLAIAPDSAFAGGREGGYFRLGDK